MEPCDTCTTPATCSHEGCQRANDCPLCIVNGSCQHPDMCRALRRTEVVEPVPECACGYPYRPCPDEENCTHPSLDDRTVGGQGHPEYMRLLDEMRELHKVKSGGYGTGSDPFANFTRIAAVTGRHRFEYPIERMIEKLARAHSLIEQGRTSEVGEEFKDIAGLALCAEAMRRDDEEVKA